MRKNSKASATFKHGMWQELSPSRCSQQDFVTFLAQNRFLSSLPLYMSHGSILKCHHFSYPYILELSADESEIQSVRQSHHCSEED